MISFSPPLFLFFFFVVGQAGRLDFLPYVREPLVFFMADLFSFFSSIFEPYGKAPDLFFFALRNLRGVAFFRLAERVSPSLPLSPLFPPPPSHTMCVCFPFDEEEVFWSRGVFSFFQKDSWERFFGNFFWISIVRVFETLVPYFSSPSFFAGLNEGWLSFFPLDGSGAAFFPPPPPPPSPLEITKLSTPLFLAGGLIVVLSPFSRNLCSGAFLPIFLSSAAPA